MPKYRSVLHLVLKMKKAITHWLSGTWESLNRAGAIATISALIMIFIPSLVDTNSAINLNWVLTIILAGLVVSGVSIVTAIQAYQKLEAEKIKHKEEIKDLNTKSQQELKSLEHQLKEAPQILALTEKMPFTHRTSQGPICLIITEHKDWLFKEGLVLVYYLKDGIESIVAKGEVIHDQTDGGVQIFCTFLEGETFKALTSAKDMWDKLIVRKMSAKALKTLTERSGYND